MNTKIIFAEDCYPLRSKVLRNGKSFEFCKYSEDHDPLSIHFGTALKDRFISVASFLPIPLDKEDVTRTQFQLRGMATDPEFQSKGIGANMLLYRKDSLEGYSFTTLTSAVGKEEFYEKQGWKKQTTSFIWPRSDKQSKDYT